MSIAGVIAAGACEESEPNVAPTATFAGCSVEDAADADVNGVGRIAVDASGAGVLVVGANVIGFAACCACALRSAAEVIEDAVDTAGTFLRRHGPFKSRNIRCRRMRSK